MTGLPDAAAETRIAPAEISAAAVPVVALRRAVAASRLLFRLRRRAISRLQRRVTQLARQTLRALAVLAVSSRLRGIIQRLLLAHKAGKPGKVRLRRVAKGKVARAADGETATPCAYGLLPPPVLIRSASLSSQRTWRPCWT